MQLVLILFIFMSSSFADVSTCQMGDLSADDCSFYNDCVENRIQCGKEGYALGYGEYYCQRFSQTFADYAEDFSSLAHLWRKTTAVCLQKEISATVDELLVNPTSSNQKDCWTLRKEAFSQHALCYTQVESSICMLPPSDVISIIRHKIIGFKDLFFTRDGLSQIREVQKICLRQLSKKSRDSRHDWWSEEALRLTNYL